MGLLGVTHMKHVIVHDEGGQRYHSNVDPEDVNAPDEDIELFDSEDELYNRLDELLGLMPAPWRQSK